jgi:hypothetical protein
MDKLFVDTQNLLDICYRQTLGTSILNPTFLIGHLALDFSVTHSSHLHPPRARNYTVEEICNTWNISNRLVQNFLHDNSHLLDSCGSADGTPMSYTACSDLRAFCTNPSRAQHLYQHFWTLRVRKCQEAIFQVINLTSDASKADDFCRQDIHLAFGIRDYFGQNHGISSTSAGILDLQNVENVAAHMALQNLLKLLSEVSWAELFLMTTASTMMTLVIASWVCHYLVSDSNIGL